MFIDKNSLQVKIGNNAYKNLGDYIVEAKYGFNKLWSKDSGRNLAGKQSGTLVGIFPKIVVQFKKLTKTELETIIPILDSAKQKVKYYDPYKKAYVEMDTYTGDYEITNKSVVGNRTYLDGTTATVKNEGFSISFIAVQRRA